MHTFEEALIDTFQGRKARVVGEDGVAYTGWVNRIDRQYRHFILQDATREDGKEVGAVVVSHTDRVELVDHDITIHRLSIDQLEASPYATREFSRAANHDYIQDVIDHRGPRFYPVVRSLEEPGMYEIIDGHKAKWVCEVANIDAHPCRIVERTDWEAAQQFVYNHLPTAENFDEDGEVESGWYGDEPAAAAVRRLYDRWDTRVLDLHPVAYTIDRLDLELPTDNSGSE